MGPWGPPSVSSHALEPEAQEPWGPVLRHRCPGALSFVELWNPILGRDPRKKPCLGKSLRSGWDGIQTKEHVFAEQRIYNLCVPVQNRRVHKSLARRPSNQPKYRAAQKATLQWKTPMIMGHASTRRTVVEEKDPSCNKKAKCHRRYSVATKSNNKMLISMLPRGSHGNAHRLFAHSGIFCRTCTFTRCAPKSHLHHVIHRSCLSCKTNTNQRF